MKRITWLLIGILFSCAGYAADKRITIHDLEAMLVSMQQAHKIDQDVASALMQITLSEELTHSAVEGLAQYLPGALSTEQMYVLEGRSAFLSPPAAEVPNLPAPDSAGQTAILAKAIEFAAALHQAPSFTGTRTVTRFQDGAPMAQLANSGAQSHMTDSSVRMFENADPYMRFLGTTETRVQTVNGALKVAVEKSSVWGASGKISEGGPEPSLSTILQDSAAGGKLAFERWQVLGGKTVAVFTYAIDRKKSHYQVEYCCFPTTSSLGSVNNLTDDVTFQTATDWKPFRTTAGYHGNVFIDPDTGVVLRVTLVAELKPADFVHQEQRRTDYGPLTIDGKTYYQPFRSYVFNEVVPFGESFARRVSVRHTLLIVTYKDYQPAG